MNAIVKAAKRLTSTLSEIELAEDAVRARQTELQAANERLASASAAKEALLDRGGPDLDQAVDAEASAQRNVDTARQRLEFASKSLTNARDREKQKIEREARAELDTLILTEGPAAFERIAGHFRGLIEEILRLAEADNRCTALARRAGIRWSGAFEDAARTAGLNFLGERIRLSSQIVLPGLGLADEKLWNGSADGRDSTDDIERRARYALSVIDKQLAAHREGAKRCKSPTADMKRRDA